MSKTWDVYVEHVISNVHAGQRDGQACFNALHAVSPDAANSVRGTAIDPFYNDALLLDFSTYVMTLDWGV